MDGLTGLAPGACPDARRGGRPGKLRSQPQVDSRSGCSFPSPPTLLPTPLPLPSTPPPLPSPPLSSLPFPPLPSASHGRHARAVKIIVSRSRSPQGSRPDGLTWQQRSRFHPNPSPPQWTQTPGPSPPTHPDLPLPPSFPPVPPGPSSPSHPRPLPSRPSLPILVSPPPPRRGGEDE